MCVFRPINQLEQTLAVCVQLQAATGYKPKEFEISLTTCQLCNAVGGTSSHSGAAGH